MNSKTDLSSFEIRTVFSEFAMCWQSKHYGNQGMLWGEITPKNHVICIKSAHNLLYFIPQSDADNTVISVGLQYRMIEVRASKP